MGNLQVHELVIHAGKGRGTDHASRNLYVRISNQFHAQPHIPVYDPEAKISHFRDLVQIIQLLTFLCRSSFDATNLQKILNEI